MDGWMGARANATIATVSATMSASVPCLVLSYNDGALSTPTRRAACLGPPSSQPAARRRRRRRRRRRWRPPSPAAPAGC
eukprot:scaffold1769_cov277-Prasinococcus_capsulatus_cf.AAC.8